jgi:hypothetical protein
MLSFSWRGHDRDIVALSKGQPAVQLFEVSIARSKGVPRLEPRESSNGIDDSHIVNVSYGRLASQRLENVPNGRHRHLEAMMYRRRCHCCSGPVHMFEARDVLWCIGILAESYEK